MHHPVHVARDCLWSMALPLAKFRPSPVIAVGPANCDYCSPLLCPS